MVPIVDDDMRLSEITIANLEDLGYVVDYTVADPFPEFGTGCRCGSKTPIVSTLVSKPPSVSSEGLERAKEVARRIFKGQHPFSAKPTNNASFGLVDHDFEVEVFYQENGVIYTIEFGRDDIT